MIGCGMLQVKRKFSKSMLLTQFVSCKGSHQLLASSPRPPPDKGTKLI